MPDALPESVSGSRTKKKLADPPLRTPAPLSPSAHPTPALVAHTQGGITLSLEEGEVDADFCKLGITDEGYSESELNQTAAVSYNSFRLSWTRMKSSFPVCSLQH